MTAGAILGYVVALIVIAALTTLLLPLRDRLSLLLIGLFLLVPVVLIAARWGWGPGLFAAVLASLSLNYYFVAPTFSSKVPDPLFSLEADEALTFVVFVFVAVLTSALLARARAGEAAALQAQRRFATLVNSIDGIIWEADAQTLKFEFVSLQAERLLGHPLERWLSDPAFWSDHLHPDDRAWVVDARVKAATERQPHELEYRMLTGDGRTVWLFDAANVLAEEGEAVRLQGVTVDISERKLAEEQRAALSEENTRLLKLVQQQLEEVRRSRRLVVAASENRRREVAEWLHGRVQGGLLVAWHSLGLCRDVLQSDPPQAAAILEEVREAIDTLRDREIRQTSHLLHPSIIRVGLIPALRSFAARFEGPTQVAIEAEAGVARLDDPSDNRIPEAVRLAAYRIVEEAIANSFRHGNASAATVSLRLSEGSELSVEVRDDGRGFDVASMQTGLGLSSIAGQAEQFGGTWAIESIPGAGTLLRATLPLVEQEAVTAPTTE